MQQAINMPKVNKRRKSVPLTKEQMDRLKAFSDSFDKQSQAAIRLGVDRNVLNRVLAYGSGHELSIKTILKNLPK